MCTLCAVFLLLGGLVVGICVSLAYNPEMYFFRQNGFWVEFRYIAQCAAAFREIPISFINLSYYLFAFISSDDVSQSNSLGKFCFFNMDEVASESLNQVSTCYLLFKGLNSHYLFQ